MNSAIKKKLAAIVTASILMVAVVVTACVLYVPGLYNGGDVPTSNTEDGGVFGMNKVTYDSSNSGLVYVSLKENAYLAMQFPTKIFIDKSETLQQAGYYYQVRAHFNGGRGYGNSAVLFSNTVFGHYSSSHASHYDTMTNAKTMGNLINSYGYSVGTTQNVSVSEFNHDDSHNQVQMLVINNDYSLVRYDLQSNADGQNVGSGKFVMPTSVHTAFLQWKQIIGGWTNVKDCYVDGFNSAGDINAGNTNNFSGYTKMSNIEIDVTVYDKSELNTAISNLQNKLNANRELLKRINGNNEEVIKRAEKLIKDATDQCLHKRDVLQTAIDEWKGKVNDYVFELDLPTPVSKTEQYNGYIKDVKADLYSNYDPLYFDLEMKVGETAVSAIQNVGKYNVAIRPKSQEFNGNAGTTFKLKWAGSEEGMQQCGIYIINPRPYQIDNLSLGVGGTNILSFNNAEQALNFNNVNITGFIETAEGGVSNSRTIKLSLSPITQDNIDSLSDTVNVKNVGQYTVYYRIIADNHEEKNGSVAIEVKKAEIKIPIVQFSQAYGSKLLTSTEILRDMVDPNMANILNATNISETKALLGQIITEFVIGELNNPIKVENGVYPDAGSYSINFRKNEAWSDRVNVSYISDNNNVGKYVINPRKVDVTWTHKDHEWYDGEGNKRPVPELSGDSTLVANTSADIGVDYIKNSLGNVMNTDAIDAGTYTAVAKCSNNNYIVDKGIEETFVIKRRKIKVELLNFVRKYAEAMTALELLKYYQQQVFEKNSGYVISLDPAVTDGKATLGEGNTAPSVFDIKFDYTSADQTVDGAYFLVNESGYRMYAELKNNNFEITESKDAKFIVNPVGITLNIQQFNTKTFNGEEQELAFPNDDNKVIILQGYESNHRDSVKIEYKELGAPDSAYSTTPLTMRNIGVKDFNYRVTAPNHKENIGHLQVSMTTAVIEFNIAGQNPQKPVYYGTEIPASYDTESAQGLEGILGITWTWGINTSAFDFSEYIRFALLDGTETNGELTDRKANANSYTVAILPQSGYDSSELNNYKITFANNGDVRAYTISPRPLTVEWKQSGSGWDSETGMSYTYDMSAPTVYPSAPARLDDGSENVVDGDTIFLSEATIGSIVNEEGYTVSTNLTDEDNKKNYYLVNPTATFFISKLKISVTINHQEAEYGNAKTVSLGTSLVPHDRPDAMWGYASGSAHFLSDHYSSFRLVSDAHSTDDNSYVNVGEYPIEMVPIDTATGAVVGNYDITIVKEGDKDAMFRIVPTSIHYTGRQFNIEWKEPAVEQRYITKDQIRNRISTVVGTDLSEFNIEMSDLIAKNDNVAIESVTNWVVGNKTTEITREEDCARYYVWIRITHKCPDEEDKSNYGIFTAKVEVNILSKWVSVVVGNKIEGAQYGNDVFDSDYMFDKLEFTKIIGILDNNGQQITDIEVAKSVLKNYVTLFVGTGDTVTPMDKNGNIGSYSIFFETKADAPDTQYENFRFLPREGEDKTSNIDAYVVGKRDVGIIWGDGGNMDEVYGEHSGIGTVSNSHKYTVTNLVNSTDNVRLTISFFVDDTVEGNTANIIGGANGHVHNVGYYVARVTAVSHPNYKLPDGGLETTFQITPRKISVKLGNREITYGDVNATRDGIVKFLNTRASGIVTYTITAGSLAKGDDVNNIFSINLAPYTLADGLEYLSANENDTSIVYTIKADNVVSGKDAIGFNYEIDWEDGALTVKEATIDFDSASVASVTFNGTEQKVEASALFYTLAGDGDKLKSGATVGYKLYDSAEDFSSDFGLVNAGNYRLSVQITAPNHKPYVNNDLSFTIHKARVELDMVQAAKRFGDTLADITSAAGVANLSEWLKLKCRITAKVTDGNGNAIVIDNVLDRFEFKVIEPGQGNGDSMQPLKIGAYDAGTYRVYHVLSEQDKQNFDVDYYQAAGSSTKCNANAYKVEKRKQAVEWTCSGDTFLGNNKFTYNNGLAPSISATVDLIKVSGGVATYEYDVELPFISESLSNRVEKGEITFNVGNYKAVVTEGAEVFNEVLKNYEFDNVELIYEVVKKNVTVTIDNASAFYGDELTKVGRGWDSSKCSSDDSYALRSVELKLVYADTDKTYLDAKDYQIVGKDTSGNYNFTFKGAGSDKAYGVFTVKKAQIIISNHTHNVDYNGKDLVLDIKENLRHETDPDGNPVYKLAGDMTWDDVSILYKQANGEFTADKPVIKGVTSTSITFMVKVNNHDDKEFVFNININKARLTVNLSKGASSEYGGKLLTSDEIFEKSKAALDDSSTLAVSLKSIITLSTVEQAVNKGTYNIRYAFVKPEYADLYDITLKGNIDAYEITAKEITVVWDYEKPFVYDKTAKNIGFTFSGVVEGDIINPTDSSGLTARDAGTYEAAINAIDNGNYKLGESAKLSWVINPRAIVVEWVLPELIYNGEIQNIAVPSVKSGLLAGDMSSIKLSDGKIAAGEYIAKATAINSNYYVSNDTFAFEIKPLEVQLVWDETELIYNGKEQAPSASIEAGQILNDDEVVVAISGARKNAGNGYVATATLSNPNYTLGDANTTQFDIAPKAITFVWENKDNLQYDEVDGEKVYQAPDAKAVGAVDGDTIEFVVDGAECDAGEGYTATVKGIKDNGNYVIDTENQSDMSVTYSISKGVNEFVGEIVLPEIVGKLPIDESVKSKFGNVVFKYYTDEACTQEVKDLAAAGEGTYWVKAFVAGTSNYDEIASAAFKVELQGGLNIALIVIGAVASVLLLGGALAVVLTMNKKKKQQGDAV